MMARKIHSLTKTTSNDGTKSSLFDRQKKNMIARKVHPLTKQNKTKQKNMMARKVHSLTQQSNDGTKSS